MPLKSDNFGRAMLATGVPRTTIKAWCDDLDVPYQTKALSWFDLVEDLDSRDCLRKNASINARRRFTQVSRGVRVVRDGVECVMRAFGSGGRLGPIITLSHRCALPLLEVIATTGYDLAVVEGGT